MPKRLARRNAHAPHTMKVENISGGAGESCAASAMKIEMFPNVPSFPSPSIRNSSLYRTQTLPRQKTERDRPVSPVFPTPLSHGWFTFWNKPCPSPLLSNIYRVNNKNGGAPLSQICPLPLCCLNVLIILNSFKCFKGAINPHHTYIPGFKGIGLWYERYRFMV